MLIHHVAIYTCDIEKLKDFFIKYFNAKANNKYYNPSTKLETYFLTFENNTKLEIMQRPEVKKKLFDNTLTTGIVHIAFKVGSKEKVDKLTELLQNDGVKIKSMPRTTGDGYYESCILDPDNNEIEIIA